jgi:hypothetical protein
MILNSCLAQHSSYTHTQSGGWRCSSVVEHCEKKSENVSNISVRNLRKNEIVTRIKVSLLEQ